MGVPTRFVLHQFPVIRALAAGAAGIVSQRLLPPTGTMVTPGPLLSEVLPPRPPDLVAAYVKHVGGDPSSYRGELPPHLFPQWGFALAGKTLAGLPYPLAKVLNGGCRLEIHGPLPANKRLHVTARLEDIDDNGSRAVLHQRITTGTATDPEILVAHLYAIIPLKKKGEAGKPVAKKERTRVPDTAREIAYFKLPESAGLDFAKLTGDFNPVHWVPAYAKASGFRNVILHGFATMARAYEGLVRNAWGGDVRRMATFDVRFTKPLVLPARVGLYLQDDRLFVGDGPSGPAYLEATFTTAKAGKNAGAKHHD